MEEKLALLKWLKGNFNTKLTSKNNVYAFYWIEFSTGSLYSDKEVLDHYETFKLSGPKDA